MTVLKDFEMCKYYKIMMYNIHRIGGRKFSIIFQGKKDTTGNFNHIYVKE